MEESKNVAGVAHTGPVAPVGLEIISQVRQLSIPLWARILAVFLAVSVLLVGCFLVLKGWMACTEGCTEKWLEHGTKIVGATFLPAVLLVYLVFAETGVTALVRKTEELLVKTIPNALKSERIDLGFEIIGQIDSCEVVATYTRGVPRARYYIVATRNGQKAVLNFLVDLNVSKANVVIFLPLRTPVDHDLNLDKLRQGLEATIKGAEHEGYIFDQLMPEVKVGNNCFVTLVARKMLPNNFLWDPSHKLHFAQDLRMFVHSVLLDGWDIFETQ